MAYDHDDRFDRYIVSRPGAVGTLAVEFEKIVNEAKREEELQQFLASNPFILSEQFPHGTHVVPKFRFGGKYVSDFLVSEMSSGGTFWNLFELESANVRLTTKSGHLSDAVRRGVQQVSDWKDWLERNRDHAAKPICSDGLGLGTIQGLWGWVVIGRRSEVTPRFNQLRHRIWEDCHITVCTYDRLIEWLKKRATFWDSWDNGIGTFLDSLTKKI